MKSISLYKGISRPKSGSLRVLAPGTAVLLAMGVGVADLAEAAPGSHNVLLAWDASVSEGVIGYRLYRGSARQYDESLSVGDVTVFSYPGVSSGATYFFAVTAYDANGEESGFSNEISHSIPGEPPPAEVRVAPGGEASVVVKGRIGHTYEVLASQSLRDWQVLGTVTLSQTGQVAWTDYDSVWYPSRFYAVRDTVPDSSDPIELPVEPVSP